MRLYHLYVVGELPRAMLYTFQQVRVFGELLFFLQSAVEADYLSVRCLRLTPSHGLDVSSCTAYGSF